MSAYTRASALFAWLGLFLLIASHALLETGRDALFLASLPSSRLPIVYLLIAALALIVAFVERRGATRAPSPLRLAVWLGAGGLATIIAGFITVADHILSIYALYAGSGLLSTLLVARFWSMLGGRLTVAVAKHLYSVLGTAAGSGAIAGYAAASAMAKWLPPQSLVIASGVILIVAAVCALLIRMPPPRLGRRPIPLHQALRGVVHHRYASIVALFVGGSAVTGTLMDFLFKSSIASAVDPSRLGVLIGQVHLGVNVLSLLIQFVAVRYVLRRGGVALAAGVLPSVVASGGLLLFMTGGFVATLVVFAFDNTIRHSLHRTVTELLYVPMPDALRTAARSVVDVAMHRLGQAFAAGLILLLSFWHADARSSFAIVVAAAAALFMVAIALKQRYFQVFRETLRAGLPERHSFPDLDIGSLSTVVDALDSGDDARVLAALDVLAQEGRGDLVPAALLHHPADPIALRALGLLAKHKPRPLIEHADRVLSRASPGVAAAMVSARTSVNPDREWLELRVQQAPLPARMAAAVELAARGWVAPDINLAIVEKVASEGNEASRAALASALGRGAPGFDHVLLRLASDRSVPVRAAAVRAMGERGDPAFLTTLLAALEDRDIRPDVREAIVTIGGDPLPFLQRALSSTSTPAAVRDQIPRTISGLGSEPASRALLAVLASPSSSRLAQRIVRELERMRCLNPDLVFDREALRAAINWALRRAFEIVQWRIALQHGVKSHPERGTTVHALLLRMLGDKYAWTIDALLRLIGLMLGSKDLDSIRLGLRSEDAVVRSSSQELLEHILPPEWRVPTLALVDTIHDTERLCAAGPYRPAGGTACDAVLHRLAVDESQTLSELAQRQLALFSNPPPPLPVASGPVQVTHA